MQYQIIYEEDALQDLTDIAHYYFEKSGIELADRMSERILNEIDSLSFMPNRCVDCPLFPKYKQLNINNLPYRAYFLIDEIQKNVHIINVIHHAKNLSKLL